MTRKALFMGTTSVSSQRTLSEIIACLVKAGARQINQTYGEGGRLIGVRFTLEVLPGNTQCFSLPAKTEPVWEIGEVWVVV